MGTYRRFCYTAIQKDRKGRIYAEVEHGRKGEVFNVYADGTVLLKENKKLYSTKDYNSTFVSHIRYHGKKSLKYALGVY